MKGNGRHGIYQLFYTFVDVRTAIKDKCLRACVHIDATTQAIVDASVVRITQLLSLQSSQTDERQSRQLRERDNYFPSSELRILFFTTIASHFISSASLGNRRPPFEESRALCYSPTLDFRPLQPRRISSPNSRRSARVALCLRIVLPGPQLPF